MGANGRPGVAGRGGAGVAGRPTGPAFAAPLATGSGAPPGQERSLERAIGATIRALRRRHERTVADLAAAAGISAGMLSKIENGQISPSLGTLQALSAVLGVPMAGLFASLDERRGCSFVRAGQGVAIERRGTKVGHRYRLLGSDTGGPTVVEPYLITLEADAEPYSGFQHAGSEVIHMLTGEVVYRHGHTLQHLRPGDTLTFDSAAPHGPEVLVVRPMTYLSIIVYPRDGP